MRRIWFTVILVGFGLYPMRVLPAEKPALNPELDRYRALGLAYMEEENFPAAIEACQQAVALAPRSASDVINLGIAHYHGDQNEESIRILKQGLELDPANVFAFYNLGLASKKIGDSTHAVEYFQRTAERDPSDAATLYNLGLSLTKLKRDDEAAGWFEKTIQIDPRHSSAYYRLFLYYAVTKKDMARAREQQKIFQELKKTEPQRPADAVDEGKFMGPIEFDLPLASLPHFTSGLRVNFTPNTSWTQPIVQALGSRDGRFLAALPDIEKRESAVVISNATMTILMIVSANGEAARAVPLPGSGWTGCAPADYDNDGDTDLLLLAKSTPTGPVEEKTVLLRNQGNWAFQDVSTILGNDLAGVADALWCDFDHEGDLDLLLARPDKGDMIFQNNGDGSFTPVSGKVSGLELGKSQSLAASDLDNDNDLDILAWSAGNLTIYANLREVKFQKWLIAEIQSAALQPKILCRDFDNDGGMDITITGLNAEGPVAWRPQGENLAPLALTSSAASSVIQCVFDANNDGFEDIVTGSNPRLRIMLPNFLVYNHSPEPFQKVDDAFAADSTTPPSQMVQFEDPVPVDLDWDGDLDLLATRRGETPGIVVFENQGGNQNHWLALKIQGSKNTVDGYGSKIQVKHDLFRVKKEVAAPVTHMGLGNREKVNVIRLTWPNGIFQNEILVASDQILSVSEKPGYAGSCPFVYTWNGREYEFIADSLSTGPLGLYVGGGFFPPRPDEYIRIRGAQMKPKDGFFNVLMREELREITYLDQMELLSATHPDAREIHVNEKFTLPPFPEFKLIGLSANARPPRRMTDNHGEDVTELIRENDRRYPKPWKPSRYDGIGEEHWFEIDLNDFRDAKTLYLFMTGYVDWPNSSHALSLEQNPSLDFVMPYLQVKDETGAWVTVLNPMGFPAGKLKTVPLDISNIFKGPDRTVRIVSTLLVHWDRIWVDPSPILDGFAVRHYPYVSADLRYGGYARCYDLAQDGPHWFDYNTLTTNARWDYHRGFFTRFGDVTPLLTAFDDRYVIMQHGDEAAVRFQAPPSETPGDVTYFLHAVGWVKDLDYSTAYSQQVEPLPFRGMSAYPFGPDEEYPLTDENLQYMVEYNTREFTRPNEPLTLPRTVATPASAHGSRPQSE
ncbi:MAG: FG-GAP-like repeat-containing protein [bacterium]